MEFRPSKQFPEWMRTARKSAFHMELRDAYAVPSESEPLRRFLNGEPPPVYDTSGWTELIRETTDRGLAISRVRVVTVPHSDYQRWLLSVTHENVDAGEDIRYLPRHLAESAHLPSDDWWLFDDELVAFNLVDSEGRPAGYGVTADPSIAAYCSSVKERLSTLAVPFYKYLQQVPVDTLE
ncbi:DUF6879 family protein [Nocardia jejuensis]|uniref:DUF6879 family protein n=1 Tax=Nocardia jejuensis TaxID=328049 RepID=UPI000A594B0B|nr:DUF6879 family protein [Nocardia jejuensis]